LATVPLLSVMCALVLDSFWLGLIFASLSQSRTLSKSILFSEYAVIRPCIAKSRAPSARPGGRTCLQLRLISLRGPHLAYVDPSMRVYFARWDPDEQFMRFMQMKVENDVMPFLTLPWTITHVIDEGSPLYGETPDSLIESGGEVIVVWEGTDPISGNSVQEKFSYIGDEVRENQEFVPVIELTAESGGELLEVNVAAFHETQPCERPFRAHSMNIEDLARV